MVAARKLRGQGLSDPASESRRGYMGRRAVPFLDSLRHGGLRSSGIGRFSIGTI